MSLYEPENGLDWGSSLAEGLVFYHEGRHPGTEYFHDSSLLGRHGTLTNMTPDSDWVPDPVHGWVLDFDGVDDRVVMPNVFDAAVIGWTVSLWVYVTGDDTHSRYLLDAHENGDASYGTAVYLRNTVQRSTGVSQNGNLGEAFANTDAQLSVNQWHLVTVFIPSNFYTTPGGCRIWYDAVEQSIDGTQVRAGVPNACTGSWSLGGRIYDDNRNLNGLLSNAAVHSRALTLMEIQVLHERQRALHWLQDEVYAAAIAAAAGGLFHPMGSMTGLGVGGPFFKNPLAA